MKSIESQAKAVWDGKTGGWGHRAGARGRQSEPRPGQTPLEHLKDRDPGVSAAGVSVTESPHSRLTEPGPWSLGLRQTHPSLWPINSN